MSSNSSSDPHLVIATPQTTETDRSPHPNSVLVPSSVYEPGPGTRTPSETRQREPENSESPLSKTVAIIERLSIAVSARDTAIHELEAENDAQAAKIGTLRSLLAHREAALKDVRSETAGQAAQIKTLIRSKLALDREADSMQIRYVAAAVRLAAESGALEAEPAGLLRKYMLARKNAGGRLQKKDWNAFWTDHPGLERAAAARPDPVCAGEAYLEASRQRLAAEDLRCALCRKGMLFLFFLLGLVMANLFRS